MPEWWGGQAGDEVPGPHFSPGTEVAGFTIEGTIASGGFGTVYRARRSGRPYAIKLVRSDPRGDREAAALRLMRHPNEVSFHGYGLWPEEDPRWLVLALELVEGLTLDAWAVEENPSALELVMRVLLPFALTLADVHASGVVHRDIKEANIVVREADGQPVLVDFGAAGLKEGALRLTMRLPPGTAEYRSPEVLRFAKQWEGEHYPFSPGDDLWAMGVVIYGLLTRTLPFGDRSNPGLNRAILEETPPAPHELNPRVPLALSELCMGMLEKDPEDRYPDAKALAEDMVELCTQADGTWRTPMFAGGRRDKSAEVPAPAVPETPARWRWRSAGPVAAAVLVLGVLLLFVQRWGSPPGLPPQHTSPRQEMASTQVTGDVGRGAEPRTSPIPAPVATETNSEEPKMKKSQTIRTLVAAGCVASSGCVSSPQQRPPPEPAECPPGAAITHERFGLLRDSVSHYVGFAPSEQRTISVRVQEGDVTVWSIGPWGMFPDEITFSGRLYFGRDRVYGRFTQATLPGGETVPVCLQMRRNQTLGVPLEPESTRNKVFIHVAALVEIVNRFE
ncbi:serine/threonine protein kinase [Archangium violaceum]|uniref:serine/threonine protein kinase n=1 Tax=Archangium violaceum TaxID=83451 RepID=UPI0036DF16E9